MAKSKTFRATPMVLKCAAVIRGALKTMPSGPEKTRATRAIEYLYKTFSGKPQPNRGIACPVNKGIVREP